MPSQPPDKQRTLTGFLRRIKKASALCVKNLVNLWTKICSISSACLILILILTLLMLGSIRTRSFSFRATVMGLSRTSGEVCASISGTLCRSDVCDAKLDRQRAAVKEDRTHCRYGRKDWDYDELVRNLGIGLGTVYHGWGLSRAVVSLLGRKPFEIVVGFRPWRWQLR